MISKMGDRWNWNPAPPLNQGNLDLFNFAQRSLSSICLITTCFPSRFINFRTCFSQLTVIFHQFRDNLLFSANWRQYLISRGQRGQKSAQVFAVIWGAGGKRLEVIGGKSSSLGYQLLATCSTEALFWSCTCWHVLKTVEKGTFFSRLGFDWRDVRYQSSDDNHRKRKTNYVWSENGWLYICNHSKINFSKSLDFVEIQRVGGHWPRTRSTFEGLQTVSAQGSRLLLRQRQMQMKR